MARWTLTVTVNAVDISASVIGTMNVEAEASTSRIATFSFQPAAGVIVPTDWIGAPVTIDYVVDPEGIPVVERVFTGVVNLPTYNPVTRVVEMSCTDNLQGHFESMTEAQILTAITGGKFDETVFGAREDGWQQALDVLSTVPKDYDINRDGVTATLADWAGGATAFTYDTASIIDYPVTLELARLRDLVNRVNIAYQCRYTRLHHREHGFGWNWGVTFCTFFSLSFALPNRDMVQSSASDASWKIQGGIAFETLPVSGTYDCGGPVVWSITDEALDQLVTNAAWTVVRRWTQTITEDYAFIVEDSGSITAYGVSAEEEGAGFQQAYDDSQWDASTGTDTPAWAVNAIGDYTEDQLTRVDSDNVIETLLQVAATRIKDTHRQNYIGARVLIEPTIERFHRVSIDSGAVTGIGKVFKYTHILDSQTGSATTDIQIAVSRGGAGIDDALLAPVPPLTGPVHVAPSASTVLPTRIGNDDTVAAYDAAWTGYTGNYNVAVGTPVANQIYPRRMRIVTPDIETESRDSLDATATVGLTRNVASPIETLTING